MIENNAMFKLSYGLFVLAASCDGKENGAIINTAMQVTDSPKKITIAVNKANYTCEMIEKTGEFTLSVLSEDVPFSVFERFGFKSGRDTDKLEGFTKTAKAQNGIFYLTEYANAYICGKVLETVDCGTHLLFIAEVTEAKVLSDKKSVTYEYYFANIKPKPEVKKKKGFVCKICGYVYEGEELPPDFICPLCKHGVEDFEPLE